MVAFKDLWYRHPANNSTQYPCVAPHGLTNLEGTFVPQGFAPGLLHQPTCNVHAADEMHYIRAADLARGLANASIPGVEKVERITGTEASHFYQKLFGRTGIVYIQDYWRRHGETTPTGDHIDVWNGYRSSTKWLMEWFSWLGYYSNYAAAREVWFWQVK
jgi:hypothetical protein